LVAEGGDVFGLAAGDEVAVLHNLLVDPVGAGVFEIGVDGGPGGDGLTFDDVGLDQAPGAVADGGDGFAGFDELFNEGYGVLVGAEDVGVDLAAGEDEGVVVGGVDIGDEMVDFDGLAPVGLVPAFDLAGFDGDDLYGGSCLLEILLGIGEFDLLVAVGGQDGDLFAGDWFGHSVLLLLDTGLLAGMELLPQNSERVVWRMALPPGFEQAEW
jgi:hypothetical protein